jgi:myo-inositol-1(or 4)-monophosphatase
LEQRAVDAYETDDNHAEFCRLNLITRGVRRLGAAGLDLAYVAAGRLDGFWEFGLSPWDMAAGALLIQEAGGVVSDFGGGQNFLQSGNIVGGNLKLHGAILKTIQPALPESLRR